MKVVILAGGKGTRLHPYTTVFPKPLVPIGEKPILEIILKQLRYFGFKEVILSVGHLGELIQAYFQNGERFKKDISIAYSKEEVPTGTAGSLAFVPGLNETFLAMNGDVLTDLDYRELVKFHKSNNAILTIAMYKKEVNLDLGVIEIDSDHHIIDYLEKPTQRHWVSMGIYVYEPEALELIKPGEYLDFNNLVLRLLKAKKKVVGFPYDKYWLDIGRHEDYERALQEFEQKRRDLHID